MTTDRAVEFARTATLTDALEEVREAVRVRVLDTLAATTAGYRMPGIDVTRGYAVDELDGHAATLLDGSGQRCSTGGAALANGTAANTLDVDDGHREVKGHPAAVVVPPALAAAEREGATVGEFLDAVYVGYELAVRAGLAIHATDGVYTGTGSWGALGAAAAVSRLRDAASDTVAHALGTAEYHAPRTPIMRGVETPGMTKDGIGWGGYTGTVAADLAARGFTGSGTVFDEADVDVTATLGEVHQVTRSYLKPYPCCRWAQPGLDAVRALRSAHDIDPETVDRIRVETFAEATSLDTRHPDTIEAAEYSYPYPVAAGLVHGRFTPTELRADVREDPLVTALADRVTLAVDDALDDRFPEECLARVTVETATDTYTSAVQRPRGARERPLPEHEVRAKVDDLLAPTVDSPDLLRDRLTTPAATVTSLVSVWR